MVIVDPLEWAYLDGMAKEQLLQEMKDSESELEDAINDQTNMVRCCMARLTAMHLAASAQNAGGQ